MDNCSIAIIDCDSLIYSAFHPNKVLGEDKQPIKENGKFVYFDKTEEEIYNSVDYLMNKIFSDTNCEGYIALVKGRGEYRKQWNSEYKADRGGEPPKYWKVTKQYLLDKYNAVEVNEIETDDAVWICRNTIPNSFIVAIDSDLLGLPGIHFNWRKAQWIETSKEEAKHRFWSNMIIGTHNNTKGIPKKGEKFAEQLFIQADVKGDSYESVVLDAYIKHFGMVEGIEEFYKNFKSLYLLEDYKNFNIPEINIINKNVF